MMKQLTLIEELKSMFVDAVIEGDIAAAHRYIQDVRRFGFANEEEKIEFLEMSSTFYQEIVLGGK